MSTSKALLPLRYCCVSTELADRSFVINTYQKTPKKKKINKDSTGLYDVLTMSMKTSSGPATSWLDLNSSGVSAGHNVSPTIDVSSQTHNEQTQLNRISQCSQPTRNYVDEVSNTSFLSFFLSFFLCLLLRRRFGGIYPAKKKKKKFVISSSPPACNQRLFFSSSSSQ